MQFSIASTLALLAAISNVSAWHLTAYDNAMDCDPGSDTEYQILEGNQGNCYTFGWSMPDVSCGHYVRGGADNMGCRGLFQAQAMYAHENTNCNFYAEDDCRGIATVREANVCVNTLEILTGGGGQAPYIKSFKCYIHFEDQFTSDVYNL
ncbi:hypothetical protein F66182_3257 [Fusarium sp. NRRL 66182]|nr:hypothetical protein F66182_3257 [Fusarium sp. NRRL 66182]